MKGKRLDILMVEKNLAESREKARSLIMAGLVSVNGMRSDKAGTQVSETAEVTVKEDPIPFVSRGGLKLSKAVSKYGLELSGVTALDVGASTGGFTDCMLQNGAKKVYAIDVGYGQLDWRLRGDERVAVMERTNARNMEPAWFGGDAIGFVSIDVSFISLKLILPGVFKCIEDEAGVVALVKPQFEAGREKVGKNGVVRDKTVHYDVLRTLAEFSRDIGFSVQHMDYSPVTGPKGNIEFLLILKKCAENGIEDISAEAAKAVEAAHGELD